MTGPLRSPFPSEMAAVAFPKSQWPARIDDERAATLIRSWLSAEADEARTPFAKGLLASPECALEVYHTGPNIIVVSFVVQPHLINMSGAMHGGVYSLLVDEITSFVIVAKEKDSVKFGVSVHISTEFIGAAQLGDRIYVEATLDKLGRTLAFTSARFFNSKGQVIATGRHTKFMQGNDFTSGGLPVGKSKL